MRLFGWDVRRAQRQGPESRPEGRSPSQSRRSYDSDYGITFGRTVKENIDFDVYDVITGAMPFVDRAFRTLARMIVPFEITGDNDATVEALNAWLNDECRVGYLFRGFTTFGRSHVRQVLQYGKSAGEIVLAKSKRDVDGLHVINSKRLQLIKDPEHGLVVGEKNAIGLARPYENQDLIVYTAFNNEGDNPHGTSLLRSIPFVANTELRIEKAIERMWRRTGAPSFSIHAKFQDDVAMPDQVLADAQAQLRSDWLASQEARWNEEGVMDFVTASQGDLSFQAIGADVKELNLETAHRTMTEQIVSSVELAPFMLGLQWSTTERLSQNQADQIIGMIGDIRVELKPDFVYIVDWVQRLRGLKGRINLKWKDVTLRDAMESARAEQVNALAQKARTENALVGWANGWWGQAEAKTEAGYENDDVDVEQDTPVIPGKASAPGPGLQARAEHQWARYP